MSDHWNCCSQLVSRWVAFCHHPSIHYLLHSPILAAKSALEASAFPTRCSGNWRLGAAEGFGSILGQQNAGSLRAQGSKPTTRTCRAGHLVRAAPSPSESSFPKWFAQHFAPCWSFCSNQGAVAGPASLGTAFSCQGVPLAPLPTAARSSRAQLQAASAPTVPNAPPELHKSCSLNYSWPWLMGGSGWNKSGFATFVIHHLPSRGGWRALGWHIPSVWDHCSKDPASGSFLRGISSLKNHL